MNHTTDGVFENAFTYRLMLTRTARISTQWRNNNQTAQNSRYISLLYMLSEVHKMKSLILLTVLLLVSFQSAPSLLHEQADEVHNYSTDDGNDDWKMGRRAPSEKKNNDTGTAINEQGVKYYTGWRGAPVVVGGTGGSGTRGVASVLNLLGIYMVYLLIYEYE
jgi:hypothetical protein